MTENPHSLSRTVLIRAPRDVVFRYFTDSERFARWWGEGSTIDGTVGGAVRIVSPGPTVALGTVQRIEPDRCIAFTYGYEKAHPELPPGSSLVTVELEDDPAGTRLVLRHELPTEKLRRLHVPGWRFQLALFANAVAAEQHAGVAAVVDRWFAAWAETDPAARLARLNACTTDDVTMRDAYACLTGREDLHDHIAMVHVHMPGTVARRTGEPRQCQGTALVDWIATDGEGRTRGKGTNVVTLAPDGRIAGVVGIGVGGVAAC